MQKELRLYPRLSQWIVQSFVRVLAVYGIVQGTFIIAGGTTRWSGNSLEVALRVPGSPATWGIVIAVAGTLSIVGSISGRLQLVVIGMFLSSAWSAFFAICFMIGAVINEATALTAIFTYIALSVLFALLGVAYRESDTQEQKWSQE